MAVSVHYPTSFPVLKTSIPRFSSFVYALLPCQPIHLKPESRSFIPQLKKSRRQCSKLPKSDSECCHCTHFPTLVAPLSARRSTNLRSVLHMSIVVYKTMSLDRSLIAERSFSMSVPDSCRFCTILVMILIQCPGEYRPIINRGIPLFIE